MRVLSSARYLLSGKGITVIIHTTFFLLFFFFPFFNVGFKTNNLLFFVRADFTRPSFCNWFRSFVRS